MSKQMWGLLVACLTWSNVFAADSYGSWAARYSCKIKILKPFSATGAATIELKNSQVEAIDVFLVFPSKDRLSSSCSIGSSRGDNQSKWTETAGVTQVEFTNGVFVHDEGDWTRISRTRNGFLVEFSNMLGHGNCGAAAELPESVFVPLNSKMCKAKVHR